ncbi:site-specific tyrosine recombinase XerC [Tahibacter amnicola]|uniref:Site-specific tyrosine recombinase XerC n=1 Tax=Tahibacter amnicola TaxID=2976241 RepID=A0ABY6BDF2_9GAMM|nr:site-specific tyrosine recombinase XerC [Tahibacter amnicola]UXI68063.1 site-specific tyrosine recombinase XerC [Tahibacter amnicola]UXI68069.1 site-specific tyrosine recombinase XerC [Tahibacter amnicola]
MPRRGEYGERRRALESPATSDSMAAWITRYLHAQLIRGLREGSLDTYRRDLSAFDSWCRERGVERPGEITKPMLERYQRHLFYYRKANGEPLTLQRQGVMLARVRSWFRWLVRHNHVAANPASDLDMPRVPRRILPEALSKDEAESLLASFDLDDGAGVLGRAMAEVFYSTGIRRVELCDLDLYDIDAVRGVLHVRCGKGRKGRMVPIGERALAWVQRYVNEVRPTFARDPADPALFINERGTRVTTSGAGDRIDQAKRRAGITKRGSCHLLRHTAATLMLENGADVRYIQELLGHAELSTTQIYTHVSITKLKAIHAATHPGAKLERKADLEGIAD